MFRIDAVHEVCVKWEWVYWRVFDSDALVDHGWRCKWFRKRAKVGGFWER